MTRTGGSTLRGIWILSLATVMLVAAGLGLTVLSVEFGEWLLTAGLMSLVVLPILRLVAAIEQLAAAREWRFVWPGLAVIVLLSIALVWPAD